MKLLQEDMFTPTISKVKNKTSVKPQRTLCLCVKNTFFSTHRHGGHGENHRECFLRKMLGHNFYNLLLNKKTCFRRSFQFNSFHS
jgi:hypothetical protein